MNQWIRIGAGIILLVAVFVVIRLVTDRTSDSAPDPQSNSVSPPEISVGPGTLSPTEAADPYRDRQTVVLDTTDGSPAPEPQTGVSAADAEKRLNTTARASVQDLNRSNAIRPETVAPTNEQPTSEGGKSSTMPSGLSRDPTSPEMSIGPAGIPPAATDIAPEDSVPGIMGSPPEASDPGVFGLPPEASDPGTSQSGPGANDPQIPGPAPEDSVPRGP